MSAQLIDGKAIAERIRDRSNPTWTRWVEAGKAPPGLGVILVGDNPASRSYVNMKEKACKAAGIYSEEHALPADTSQAQVLRLIEDFNRNPKIHGILVQAPGAGASGHRENSHAVSPEKDVDGFHPETLGGCGKVIRGLCPVPPWDS